ncbi:Uncharacterised protein [Shigella sonnei]|nr:Uncharacterised protein [Shigella sonnei]CSS16933.1 Uncharacterised protein [Shigella sonnei]
MQFNAELVADSLGISQIRCRCAIFLTVVFFPVLHKQAFNLISLLLQQPGRNGGIDTAGHADDYFFCGFRHWITHDIELQGGVFYHAAF